MFPFSTPWKYQKTFSSLELPGVVKSEHKAEKEQSDVKKKLMEEIDNVNKETELTNWTIDKLRENADNMGFRAEENITWWHYCATTIHPRVPYLYMRRNLQNWF